MNLRQMLTGQQDRTIANNQQYALTCLDCTRLECSQIQSGCREIKHVNTTGEIEDRVSADAANAICTIPASAHQNAVVAST